MPLQRMFKSPTASLSRVELRCPGAGRLRPPCRRQSMSTPGGWWLRSRTCLSSRAVPVQALDHHPAADTAHRWAGSTQTGAGASRQAFAT